MEFQYVRNRFVFQDFSKDRLRYHCIERDEVLWSFTNSWRFNNLHKAEGFLLYAVPWSQESICISSHPPLCLSEVLSKKASWAMQWPQWGCCSFSWDGSVLHCAGWNTAPHCSVSSASRAPCSKGSVEGEGTQSLSHPRKEKFPAVISA